MICTMAFANVNVVDMDRRTAGDAAVTLIDRFDEIARTRQGSIAVECGTLHTSYAELSTASKRLATYLYRERGVRQGDRVALCVEPGTETVVAILAILRCGAAYVPLDVGSPAQRNRLIIEDSCPRVVLGEVGDITVNAPVLPAAAIRRICWEPAAATRLPELATTADDICYIIYTSGTTGVPKGVPITHRNVAALFEATEQLFDFRADDAWLLYHSVAFDFSVWELWGPLLHGGRLIVVDRWTKLSPGACADLVLDRRVTVLNQTPTAFTVMSRALSEKVGDPAELPLRYIVFGGERLVAAGLRPWVRRFGFDRPQLINMYGLTEATVHTTHHRVGPADLAGVESVIGRPLPGFVARVVDETGRDADRGELMVAGPQVAAGYLNRPELTGRRFGPDPAGLLADAVFYRTGDLVERRGETLCYLGRADQQVKIRGHRIELGEVAAAVSAVHDVEQVCVVLIDSGTEPLLACGYTTRSGEPIPLRKFRREIRTRVPQYMLPSRFHRFDRLPLTVNGKIDSEVIRKEMETNK